MATFVSIHAPRAGRDMSVEDAGGAVIMFQSTRPVRGATWSSSESVYALLVSIHAPRAGRDYVGLYEKYNEFLFQSTRPVRGATRLPAQARQP